MSVIVRIAVLIILVLITVFTVVTIVAPKIRDDKSYVAASLDKEHRLREIQGKRIVLIGGSNLALGINSSEISKRVSLPVINMGLHAGLGLPFALNESKSFLKKDDIVILSIEYFLGDGEDKLKSQLIDVNEDAKNYVQKGLFELIRLWTAQMQRCVSTGFYKAIGSDKKDPIYRRDGFTVEGDLRSHWSQQPTKELTGFIKFEKGYEKGTALMKNFIKDAKDKGCKVYITYPAYPIYAFDENREAIINLYESFQNELDCKMLGSPKTFLLSRVFFFDTVYHLTKEGTDKRTDILVDLLQKELKMI
jgi:hypothetical protein